MNRKFGILLLFTILALSAVLIAAGFTPQRWIQGSRTEFLKGTPESASITSEGTIMLPPVAEMLFETPQPFIWDIAIDSKGQLYVSGGNDGVIYDGRGNPLHDDEKPEIYALAVGPDGKLYFGTSPSGAVYRIGSDGKAEEFFAPGETRGDQTIPERYIWDMQFDANGNLYVATGIEGRVYKVSPDGKGSVIFDSDEANITKLTIDNRGRIFFGSDPGGQIFQMDQAGKVFVLFDSPMKEINNVAATADGIIYATGIAEGALKQGPADQNHTTLQEKNDAPLLSKTSSVTVASTSDGAVSNGEISALYRILQDNTVEMVWSSKTQVAHSLAVDRDGQAIFGTGPKGMIIAVDGNGTERVLRTLEGSQVTALYYNRGDLYAAVSNLGKIYKLSNRFAEKGVYLSQVKDTGTASTYGAIRWRGEGTGIRIFSRTGNTSEPDNTWSAWSAPYDDPVESKIASPPARFVQWKAELSTTEPGSSPKLKSVSVYYMPNNLRPRVRTVALLPIGITFKGGISDPDAESIPAEIIEELKDHKISVSVGNLMGKPVFERYMRSVRWSAEDTNGDTLIYRLLYRSIDDSTWSPLADNITDEFFSFDTRSLADGTYILRVEADDLPSNPAAKALTGVLDTQPFDVDNTPPKVEGLAATAAGSIATVTFNAVDEFSAIKSIRLRVDSGTWRVAMPQDGIPDSKSESVNVQLTGISAGEHVITVQVMDELYNIGSNSTKLRVR